MPRTCTICGHAEREAIDAAIAGGEPYRSITERFGVSAGAIARHKHDHMPAHVARAQDAHEVAQADDLLAQLDRLREDAARIGRKAEKAESYPAALQAVREQSRIIELLLEVAGELQRAPVIVMAPQWIELRGVILGALGPHPEARAAVADALETVSDGRAG